jgi:hypothetical protein
MKGNPMKALVTVLAGLWTLSLLGSTAAQATDFEVIYGDDNRKDLCDPQAHPQYKDWARSTAALVFRAQITDDSADAATKHLPTETFASSFNLCAEERFGAQPNPAFCSGFLVGPNIFVTAGHCIEDQSACDTISVVFDFAMTTTDAVPTNVNAGNIYNCKKLIAREQPFGNATDYAVIELDRNVEGREPLKFRTEGKIEVGTELVVIGHPSGLPTKIADGARVRSTDAGPYFVANLDTYGGNSGSAVFNASTGEVEGILVRGENDFVTGAGGCRVSNVCLNDACRGEDVTRSTEFAKHVPTP